MANTFKYLEDVELKSSTKSIVLYEDVISNLTFDYDSGQKTATGEKYSLDTDGLHAVLGYTKLKYKVESEILYLEPIKVEYNKQVYKPGFVKVQMSVMGGKPENYAKYLKLAFLKNEIKFSLVSCYTKDDTDGQSKAKEESKTYGLLAKWYYIQSMSLARKGNGSTIVTITCYSPDYKLTINKYCQAFQGKTFGKDIFAGTLKSKYGYADGSTSAASSPAYSYNLKNLMFLGYDSANKHDSENNNELLQPYLLQYNESFYDFLCRVANRCGELLYYEDGILRLGLNDKAKSLVANKDINTGNAIKYTLANLHPVYVDYPEISMDDPTTDAAEPFFYNSSRNNAGSDGTVANTNKIIETKVDVNTKPDAKKNYYKSTLGYDESLYYYSKDDEPEANINFESAEAVAFLTTLFKSDEFVPGLLEASVNLLMRKLGEYDSTTNLVCNMRQRENEEFEKILYLAKDGKVDTKNNVSILTSVYDNLCSMFYEKVEKYEHQVAKAKISMNFDNQTPGVGLGDPVSISDMNPAYIVTAMHGEFTKDSHKHVVEAVPVLAKPSGADLLGRTTASALIMPPYAVPHIITGSPQEAIVSDVEDPLELGRVRVYYPWQSKDNNAYAVTPWIRMTTPFASGIGGMFMTPDIGSHVMVNYFDNNMEHPYVDGAMFYRGQGAPGFGLEYDDAKPYSKAFQPTSHPRSIQSGSGHGIVFTDKPDSDLIEDHLSPFPFQLLKPAGFSMLPTNSGGMKLCDASGIYSINMSADSRSISIDSPLGTVSVNAFTGITISAPNGNVKIVGKNISLEAGNNITLKSGTNIQDRDIPISEKLGGGIGTAIGKAIGKAGDSVNNKILTATKFNLKKFIDLSFIRSIWEIIFRPVEGTLSMSTNRNITMKAGLGKPMIPSSFISESSGMQKLKIDENAKDDYTRFTRQLMDVVGQINNRYSQALNLARTVSDNLSGVCNAFDAAMNFLKSDLVENYRYGDTKKYFADDLWNRDKIFTFDDVSGINKPKGMAENDQVYDHIDAVEVFVQSLNVALSGIAAIKGFMPDDSKGQKFNQTVIFELKKQKYGKDKKKLKVNELQLDFKPFGDTDIKAICCTDSKHININSENKALVTKNILFACVQSFADIMGVTYSKNDDGTPYSSKDASADWDTFVNHIKAPDPAAKTTAGIFFGNMGKKLLESGKDYIGFNDKVAFLNYDGSAGPRAFTDITTGGSVLISNSKGTTLRLKDNGDGFVPMKNPGIGYLQEYLKKAVTNVDDFVDIDKV